MDYFYFSAKEYEARRYSYDRKYVYILKAGRLYYRRLAKGRISQDDLTRISLHPQGIEALERWLKEKHLVKNQITHFPKNEEGLNMRYNLGIKVGQQDFSQLYTGAEQQIQEKMPELGNLWRLLQKQIQPIPSKSANDSEAEKPIPSINLQLIRTSGSGTKIRKKYYELNENLLKIEDTDSGQVQSFPISLYEKRRITRFLKEEMKSLKESCTGKQIRTALLDEPVSMDFRLDLGGILVSQRIQGMHFSLIEQLPFLLLELIEAKFLQIAKRATSPVPHQAISL